MKKSLKMITLLACTLLLSISSLAQTISLPITFTSATNSVTLTIGTHPNATDDFDTDIDVFAPPPPPANALNAWSTINNDNYLSDFRDTTSAEKQFNISIQAESGSSIVISWDPQILVDKGTFEIVDKMTGTQFGPLDMTLVNSLDLSTTGGLLDNGFMVRMTLGQNTGVSNEEDVHVAGFALSQNFPNPFNNETEISFYVPEADAVTLVIYDLTGKKIADLLNRQLAPGRHMVSWKPQNVSNGLYFYRLTSKNQTLIKSMVITR